MPNLGKNIFHSNTLEKKNNNNKDSLFIESAPLNTIDDLNEISKQFFVLRGFTGFKKQKQVQFL